MRVWDKIDPSRLCRNHLLAEHRETLAIWSIITNNKNGYRNHPEVKRWDGHLGALWIRHNDIRMEARQREYNFKELPNFMSKIPNSKETYIIPKPWDNQLETLKLKGCGCRI